MASSLMDFLIILVGLIIIGAMIFAAIEFIATDPRFKQISRFAVGGILVLLFLYAVKGVLFGGGGGTGLVTPLALLYFAIAVIVILVVWFLIDWALKWLAGVFPPLAPFMSVITFVISALVLIAILVAAADLLVGGGSRIFTIGQQPIPRQDRDLGR